MADNRPGATVTAAVAAFEEGAWRDRHDRLATEEPMEIRVGGRSVTVTMRTPGHDFELAAGLLYAEGVIGGAADIAAIRYCVDAEQQWNVVTVDLRAGVAPVLPERSFGATSACGVCGTATLDALAARPFGAAAGAGPRVAASVLLGLADRLTEQQGGFATTGGLHAAGLFDPAGALLTLREDVGRHNAVDKVVGRALLDQQLPLADRVLVLSGRSGYELLQKALAAGITFVASVGAPSSLAVQLAQRFGITLVGFLRPGRFNVYAGGERLA